VAKPNIEFFNHAMAKAGCKAEEVVYLGDTWDTDVEGGMGAE
jgi:FMN phosphatase YigB (HAD superfamily)